MECCQAIFELLGNQQSIYGTYCFERMGAVSCDMTWVEDVTK